MAHFISQTINMQGSVPSSPNQSLSDSSGTEESLKIMSDDATGKLEKSLEGFPESPRSECSDSSSGVDTPDKRFSGKWKGEFSLLVPKRKLISPFLNELSFLHLKYSLYLFLSHSLYLSVSFSLSLLEICMN